MIWTDISKESFVNEIVAPRRPVQSAVDQTVGDGD
jgi:hypothetical protein